MHFLISFFCVVLTVHIMVFYNVYTVEGSKLKSETNSTTVGEGIDKLGGIYMFGRYMPIWSVILVEIFFAYLFIMSFGLPLGIYLGSQIFSSPNDSMILKQTAITSATVGVMCPSMTFVSACIYYPYYNGFQVSTLLSNWINNICVNFMIVWIAENWYVQPLSRVLLRLLIGCLKKKTPKKDEDSNSLSYEPSKTEITESESQKENNENGA